MIMVLLPKHSRIFEDLSASRLVILTWYESTSMAESFPALTVTCVMKHASTANKRTYQMVVGLFAWRQMAEREECWQEKGVRMLWRFEHGEVFKPAKSKYQRLHLPHTKSYQRTWIDPYKNKIREEEKTIFKETTQKCSQPTFATPRTTTPT